LREVRADGALLISPYYNNPRRTASSGITRRRGCVDLPLIVYNIPGRTGSNIARKPSRA